MERFGTTGVVIGACHRRHRHQEFIRFLNSVDGVIRETAEPGVEVKEGDYLLAVNGVETNDARSTILAISRMGPGEQVSLRIQRDGSVFIRLDRSPALGLLRHGLLAAPLGRELGSAIAMPR